MLGKKLINSGPTSGGGGANTFASENFNTVLYTGTGSAQRIGGYINRGAVFNGSNSFISLPQNTDFDLNGNGSFSIWVQRNNTSRVWIIDKANGGSGNYGWQLYFHNGQYGFQMHDTSNNIITVSSGTSGIATNAWEHIVITSNTSRVYKMYVNGTLKNTQTLSAAVSVNTNGVTLGKYSLASGYEVNGTMDQLRFFNKELSQSEVTTLYGETFASTTISTTDIFNDNSGVALYQLDGNANDTGGVSGKYGEAAIFNGSSSKITIPGGNFNLTTYSLSFWIYATDYNQTNTTVVNIGLDNSPGNWGGLAFGVNANKIFYFGGDVAGVGGSGFFTQTGTTNITNANWVHVAMVVNGTSVTGYVNGAQDSGLSRTLGANIVYKSASSNHIGVRSGSFGSYGWWNGRVDEVRVYSDTLTATEIGYIYNNTTASIPTDNLTAYYKLNGNARDEQQLYNGTATNVTYAYDGTASNVTYQEATKFQPDLVWIKNRDRSVDHALFDSIRGATQVIRPNQSTADGAFSDSLTSFDSNGFTLGSDAQWWVNKSGDDYVSWCFNAGSGSVTSGTGTGSITNVSYKANTNAGFSIVKYTGSQSAGTVTHGLGVKPNLVLYKDLDAPNNWTVYSSDLTVSHYLKLNGTNAKTADAYNIFNGEPDTSVLKIGSGTSINTSGNDIIAYCFANIDSYQKIGTYTGNGSANGPIVQTGFEPAFLLIKRTDSSGFWALHDNKRDTANPRNAALYANAANAESTAQAVNFLSNGFQPVTTDSDVNASGTYLYLAIAADPDQTDPTVENSFSPILWSGTGSARSVTGLGFKPDLIWWKARNANNYNWKAVDSINGATKNLYNNLTNSLASDVATTSFDNDGFTFGSGGNGNASGINYVGYAWKAGDHDDSIPQINTEGTIQSIVSVNDAAGFSIVKFTTSGGTGTVGHGLSSTPEVVLMKRTNTTSDWYFFTTAIDGSMDLLRLNTTNSQIADSTQAFTSTTFKDWASSGDWIAYCWYSVSGHSKIGSYTGTGYSGNAQTLGFRPRFIMIKSSSNAEPWFMLDSKRNPTNPVNNRLMADSSAAEDGGGVHTVDFTDTGFTANGTVGNGTNGNGVSYIYMAFK